MFSKSEEQDPLTIDCYTFGSTIVGGSCEDAELRVLNSQAYRTSGELVYEPVLETSGDSQSEGIYLRISSKSLGLFNFNHTFSFKNSEIEKWRKRARKIYGVVFYLLIIGNVVTLQNGSYLMIELNNNSKKYGSSNIEIETHIRTLGYKVLMDHWPDKVFYRP